MDQLPHCPYALHRDHKDLDLVWRDRNLKFHRYDLLDPTPRIEELLAELDADPTAIFWG